MNMILASNHAFSTATLILDPCTPTRTIVRNILLLLIIGFQYFLHHGHQSFLVFNYELVLFTENEPYCFICFLVDISIFSPGHRLNPSAHVLKFLLSEANWLQTLTCWFIKASKAWPAHGISRI